MKPWAVTILLVMTGGLGNAAYAQDSTDSQETNLKNWYNDPFFTLSQAFADCPVPLGPFMTRAQMEDDAHYRVERGTTCWLAHKCTKPNSYMYDAPIADAIHAHFTNPHAFDGTSLWITVQRRFVYVEGCVPAGFDAHALESQMEAIPDVEQVFMRVSPSTHSPLPYKTLAAPDAPVMDPASAPAN